MAGLARAALGIARFDHAAGAALRIAEASGRARAPLARRRQTAREARAVQARLARAAGDARARIAEAHARGEAALAPGIARARRGAGIELAGPGEAAQPGPAVAIGGAARWAPVERAGVGARRPTAVAGVERAAVEVASAGAAHRDGERGERPEPGRADGPRFDAHEPAQRVEPRRGGQRPSVRPDSEGCGSGHVSRERHRREENSGAPAEPVRRRGPENDQQEGGKARRSRIFARAAPASTTLDAMEGGAFESVEGRARALARDPLSLPAFPPFCSILSASL